MAKKGLGAGLGALFGEDSLDSAVQTLPLSRIEPRIGQPRTDFDEEALQELSDSISLYGVLQPITVRALESGYYQIVAGERRWRASRMAGLREVPVRILDIDDQKAQELALVENLQREDLNPMEEAQGYRDLMDQYGLTQEQVSLSVGKSRSSVANMLRLLSLDASVAGMVKTGEISYGHARALLALEDGEKQKQAVKLIVDKGLSVRQTEALVSKLKASHKETKKTVSDEIDYAEETAKNLGQLLGRKVKISDAGKKGKIILEYYGADDRETLIRALKNLK